MRSSSAALVMARVRQEDPRIIWAAAFTDQATRSGEIY